MIGSIRVIVPSKFFMLTFDFYAESAAKVDAIMVAAKLKIRLQNVALAQ